MAGEATVGSILGYLRLDRSDWDAELNAAGAKADELARHNPNIKIGTNATSAIAQLSAVAVATKRLQDAQGAEAVAEARLQSLRDRGITDAGRLAAAEEAVTKARRSQAAAVIALAAAQDTEHAAATRTTSDTQELKSAADNAKGSVLSLWDALLLAPAAIPILGVASGALIGLLPVAATAMLAIKGIENQMKAGALQGTQFAATVDTLKSDLTTLETTAAGGIMNGVNKALSASQGLFGQVNGLIAVMSTQLGNIVAGAAPALLRILTELNPLFVTFGDLLTRGATELENWATHSTGVQAFVAYVQAQLPTVMSFLGNLIVLVSHLAQAFAPFGSSLLYSLNLFVHALNAIPVGVLQQAIPIATSLYVALKAFALLTPGVNSIGGAFRSLVANLKLADAQTAASAEAQNVASMQITAAVAAESASIADAKATEAEAAADGAVAEAAAAEEIGAADVALTQLIAENAIEQAGSFRAAAVAAAASAATIATEADEAASASAAAGGVAAAGWSAMLGPVGALAVGAGILGMSFLHTGQHAQQLQEEVNTLTDAIKQDSGAVGENTRQYIVNALQKSGALDDARKLGYSLSQVTDAVISGGAAYSALTQSISMYTIGVYGATKDTSAQNAAARDLLGVLNDTHGALGAARQAYANEQAAMGEATNSTKAGTSATQAQAQALAELNTKLGDFASKALGAAQTEDQFKSAVLNVSSSVKQNGTSLSENTSKGLANRDALLSAMQAALSYRDAQEKAGTSTAAANLTLAANITQLENAAIKAGLNKDEVYKMVKQMGLVPKNIQTEFETNAEQVAAEVANLRQQIESVPGIGASVNANGLIGIEGGGHYATGGLITGSGPKGVDSVPLVGAPGEFVMSDRAVDKYGLPFMKALNAGTFSMPAVKMSATPVTVNTSSSPVDFTPLVTRLDAIERHLAVAPEKIGSEVAVQGAGLYARAGAATGVVLRRAQRKGAM